MRVRVLIVLLSLCYAGCAAQRPAPETPPRPAEPGSGTEAPEPSEPRPSPIPLPPPEPPPHPAEGSEVPQPRRGGWIGVVIEPGPWRDAVVDTAVGEPLTLAGWEWTGSTEACRLLRLSEGPAYPDGSPVTGASVLAAWDRELDAGLSAEHWLLALSDTAALLRSGERRLAAVHDVRVRDGALEFCPDTPDLFARLAHPALWDVRTARDGTREGGGPFREAADGTLVPNPGHVGPGPFVERVEPVEPNGALPLLFKLGEAHLAVVFGRDVGKLLATPGVVRLERLPSWDRTYYLWLNPTKRWTNDPAFRRWLAGVVDRDGIVDYLFDGRGERAYVLTPGRSDVPLYRLRPDRPLSSTTVPRLSLRYDSTDPRSATLALRLKAVLGAKNVELSLEPRPPDRLHEDLTVGDVEIALLAHHPATTDPVLALFDVVWWPGTPAADALEILLAAAHEAGPTPRAEAAWRAEQALLGDARVVPLVRLEAWLARHPQLECPPSGPDGDLHLGEAWWRP